jgi:hypothetical protein
MRDQRLNPGERVKDVRCTDVTLAVDLADGRTITEELSTKGLLRGAPSPGEAASSK